MTEGLEQLHGLEVALEAWPAGTGVALSVRDDLGHINLRGDPANSRFREAAEKALGQELPTEPNTVSAADVTICWLGPDEWLVLADAGNTTALSRSLQDSLKGQHFAVNVVSGGQIALELSGERVREVLAKGSTLDFHPKVFVQGLCAQSGLAKASVLFAMTGENRMLIVVRRSFSDYLVSWLMNAV